CSATKACGRNSASRPTCATLLFGSNRREPRTLERRSLCGAPLFARSCVPDAGGQTHPRERRDRRACLRARPKGMFRRPPRAHDRHMKALSLAVLLSVALGTSVAAPAGARTLNLDLLSGLTLVAARAE